MDNSSLFLRENESRNSLLVIADLMPLINLSIFHGISMYNISIRHGPSMYSLSNFHGLSMYTISI